MRSFDEIYAIAAERKGAEALEAALGQPKSTAELMQIPEDRWLSRMTRSVFEAGFNWKVVDNMWPGFETAFRGFDVNPCAFMPDDWFEELVSDRRIVRHGPKIRAVQSNAQFIQDLRDEGGIAETIANWPASEYAALLEMLKKRGTRLGGMTGPYFLRFMGCDSYILSRDVTTRLIAEGVIDKMPTSKSAMKSVQEAFNIWADQSGRSLTEISRVLARSVG